MIFMLVPEILWPLLTKQDRWLECHNFITFKHEYNKYMVCNMYCIVNKSNLCVNIYPLKSLNKKNFLLKLLVFIYRNYFSYFVLPYLNYWSLRDTLLHIHQSICTTTKKFRNVIGLNYAFSHFSNNIMQEIDPKILSLIDDIFKFLFWEVLS